MSTGPCAAYLSDLCRGAEDHAVTTASRCLPVCMAVCMPRRPSALGQNERLTECPDLRSAAVSVVHAL